MFNLIIPAHDIEYFDATGKLQKVDGSKEGSSRVNVNGYHFKCVSRQCEQDPKDLFPADFMQSKVDLLDCEKATIVARPVTNDLFGVSVVTESDLSLGSDEFQVELARLTEELETVAQFSGKDIELMAYNTRKMIPPKRSAQGLFVILGAVPPGNPTSRHATHFFGVQIVESGYRTSLPAPTLDVGHVVKNDLDEAVAQIVDDTIYLFVPINRTGIPQLVDPTVRLFRRAMNLAWNTYINGDAVESIALQEITERQNYLVRAVDPNREVARLRNEISNADEEIRNAQHILTENLAKRAMLIATIEGIRTRRSFDLETEWENLQASPFLDSICEASNGGVYYRSKPLAITDENGTERFIGRLVVSIEQPSDILVWSLDNPHPGGVPHPHVNQYGGVCLGNVTQSVSHLLAEQREAASAVLILRMLAEGYDPRLTEHRLGEWPTPVEWERRQERRGRTSDSSNPNRPTLAEITIDKEAANEPLPSIPYAEEGPDSASDSGGSRLDRFLRSLCFGQGRSL